MMREAATGRIFYSRRGYGSTASASTETTSSGQLSSNSSARGASIDSDCAMTKIL
jgi:hypothetical protein